MSQSYRLHKLRNSLIGWKDKLRKSEESSGVSWSSTEESAQRSRQMGISWKEGPVTAKTCTELTGVFHPQSQGTAPAIQGPQLLQGKTSKSRSVPTKKTPKHIPCTDAPRTHGSWTATTTVRDATVVQLKVQSGWNQFTTRKNGKCMPGKNSVSPGLSMN